MTWKEFLRRFFYHCWVWVVVGSAPSKITYTLKANRGSWQEAFDAIYDFWYPFVDPEKIVFPRIHPVSCEVFLSSRKGMKPAQVLEKFGDSICTLAELLELVAHWSRHSLHDTARPEVFWRDPQGKLMGAQLHTYDGACWLTILEVKKDQLVEHFVAFRRPQATSSAAA